MPACDSHIHIFDAADVPAYRKVQEQIGTSRVVIVTPRPHVTDNGVTLAAIEALGRDRARGVAVVRPDVTDEQLAALDKGGVRGIRFSVYQPEGQVVSIDMIEPLSKRIAALGWHVQLHMRADQIVANAAMIERLPSTIVFDHMGRIPVEHGVRSAAFSTILRLMNRGRAWVKLSGPYLDAPQDGPRFASMAPLASAWVAAAPQRVVWGSDWPHPTEKHGKPDDGVLFDLLSDWAPDADVRRRILVDNPAELYAF